jgi:hypothetical protein
MVYNPNCAVGEINMQAYKNLMFNEESGRYRHEMAKYRKKGDEV